MHQMLNAIVGLGNGVICFQNGDQILIIMAIAHSSNDDLVEKKTLTL